MALFTKLRCSQRRQAGILVVVLIGIIILFALTTIQQKDEPGDVFIEVEDEIAKQSRPVSLTNSVEKTTNMDLSHWMCSKHY